MTRVSVDRHEDRAPRRAIADCRNYLRHLLSEQNKPALEREPWGLPPAGTRFSGRAVWKDSDQEACETKSGDIVFKAEVHQDGDARRITVRLGNPESLAEIFGEESDEAARLHSVSVQAFRWDLAERVEAAIEDLPDEFRASPEACAIHLHHLHMQCPALQHSGGKCLGDSAATVRVDDADIALFYISKMRGCSLSKAAEEMAVAENDLGGVAWQTLTGIHAAMARVDAMRAPGADLYEYPDFADLRARNPSHALVKRQRKIIQAYKDHANRGFGWKALGFNDPWEVLCARQPQRPEWELFFALRTVLSGSLAKDLSGFIRRGLGSA